LIYPPHTILGIDRHHRGDVEVVKRPKNHRLKSVSGQETPPSWLKDDRL
jgi:hypothetical protein